jgi:signal transduction histidine kinase
MSNHNSFAEVASSMYKRVPVKIINNKIFKMSDRDIKMRKALRISARRTRLNIIYALLVASIALTLFNAFSVLNDMRVEKKFLSTDLIHFSFFMLLSLTCSFSLVTIVKKDLNNARLVSRLRAGNRQLEAEVRKRTGQLAEALMAKDHFLAIATHDLKAPLNGIIGLVNLIRIDNHSTSAMDVNYLNHIEHSCNKMKNLIEDILEINRIEQGRAVATFQKVEIQTLLQNLYVSFSEEARRKNIDLIFPQLTHTIETDPEILTRILENLLSNALKFSLPGKCVWLRVNISDYITFEVEDQGPGIPLSDQPKLFAKFQRLSNRPTNSESSTGLGLSIVKELTHRLEGNINFKTQVGKGSTFIVTLPTSLTKNMLR